MKDFELARKFYALICQNLNKHNSIIYICGKNEHKHELLDGLLFDGAHVFDCGDMDKEAFLSLQSDGKIYLEEARIQFYFREETDIMDIQKVDSYIHDMNAFCAKYWA